MAFIVCLRSMTKKAGRLSCTCVPGLTKAWRLLCVCVPEQKRHGVYSVFAFQEEKGRAFMMFAF